MLRTRVASSKLLFDIVIYYTDLISKNHVEKFS
jgi:hypothetical protein